VATRSSQASEQLRAYTDALRQTAEKLEFDGKSSAAHAANAVGDRLERSAGYLERSEPQQLLHDAEDFGRRNPWVVIAAGVGVGLVAARFLKASSRRRYETASYPYALPEARQLPPAVPAPGPADPLPMTAPPATWAGSE
jgi:ElaB/YqjD/DUF883 family membrane-anchored ribosome-binding protein